MYVAPIHLDSIYKSLFCYKQSKTPVKDIVIGALRGAARELARHEESVFETEITILRQVASRYGVQHIVKEVFYDYEDWWSEIFPKDYEDYLSLDALSDLSGTDSSLVSLGQGHVKQKNEITDYGITSLVDFDDALSL